MHSLLRREIGQRLCRVAKQRVSCVPRAVGLFGVFSIELAIACLAPDASISLVIGAQGLGMFDASAAWLARSATVVRRTLSTSSAVISAMTGRRPLMSI